MLDARQKLIQELEEDGFHEVIFVSSEVFLEIKPLSSEDLSLIKYFKYSRPIFSENRCMDYKVRVTIGRGEISIHSNGYSSSFFLEDDSINNVKKFLYCLENNFLYYSIYNQTSFDMSLDRWLSSPDNIMGYHVKVNGERIFFSEEDFENKLFACLSFQILKSIETRRILENSSPDETNLNPIIKAILRSNHA